MCVRVERLRCFRRVTTAKDVGRTTEELGVSRPPLDCRVGRLRTRLGIGLFRQAETNIALARTKGLLCSEARGVLDCIHSARLRMSGTKGGRILHVKVAPAAIAAVVPCVSEFSERGYSMGFRMESTVAFALLGCLVSKVVSISMIHAPVGLRNLGCLRLSRRPVVTILPPRVPRGRAGGRNVDLGRLAKYPLVVCQQCRRFLVGTFKRGGLRPSVFYIYSSPESTVL